MKRYEIDDLIEKIRDCVDRHALENPGEYRRYTVGDKKNDGVNEYGVADAANILYTIGDFPRDKETREGFVKTLQKMQDPETGLFSESTHHPVHTTAHCTAALELFDAAPLYPCYAYSHLLEKDALYSYLEKDIRWDTAPWRDSHLGAGILPIFVNTGMADLRWKELYFDWMWEHTDPESGFIFAGEKMEAGLYQYMAASFHYFFNHEAERRPFRYPERVIDSCLLLMREGIDNENAPAPMVRYCSFIDIDVVYCLTRAMRKTPHRFDECIAMLEEYEAAYLATMYRVSNEEDPYFNDLHCLFGAVCCLAELQQALPGTIITEQPLRLVLDRRPFI